MHANFELTTGNEALAILVLTPIKIDDRFDPAMTRDYLGVSLGEARIAALIAAGLSPREISIDLGLTEETVRVTLKQVYRKTGFNRQNELAAAIHALRALPRAPNF
jgi:DNA-binding CsgD family transcriptional regulator